MASGPFATAVKLLTLGYSVIPSGGGDKGKAPLVDWKEYQERKPTEAEMEKWQRELKPQLWGIVTGAISGVVVLDADTPEARGLLGSLAPHVITPRGGAHFYFHHPGHPVKTVARLLPGLDVRGDGGFVNLVGPGYQIQRLPTPDTVYSWAGLPERIRQALNGSKPTPALATPAGETIPDHQRNATLTSLAGSMRRRGMPKSAVVAALLEVNRLQCQPPLPESEVRGIAASIARYEPVPELAPDTEIVCMADVQAEAVSWLWRPYIPMGKVTLLEGDPGVGKSWLSLAIATAVSLGKGLPGQEHGEPAAVVIASAEDGLADTIRPRLDAMGADVSRISAIAGALTLNENGFALLESYLERVRPALLIIDPLVAYVGDRVDIFRPNETRQVMARLARLAEKYHIAILAVRHLTKGGMSKAIYRGLGSIDFTAACRSVLLAGCDAEDPLNRALVHIKSNLAPTGPSVGYELKGGFYWTGESSLTAAQILAADNGAGTSELDEAMSFLKGELAGGEVPAKDVYQAAQDTGIAKRTLERAKAKLQVKSGKVGDTWFWHLPELTSPTSPYKDFGDVENIEAKKEVVAEGLGDLDGSQPYVATPVKKTGLEEGRGGRCVEVM